MAPKRGERDELWDTVVAIYYPDDRMTEALRGKINSALRILRAARATPEQIKERANEYKRAWPNITFSVMGLAKQWEELGAMVQKTSYTARSRALRDEALAREHAGRKMEADTIAKGRAAVQQWWSALSDQEIAHLVNQVRKDNPPRIVQKEIQDGNWRESRVLRAFAWAIWLEQAE